MEISQYLRFVVALIAVLFLVGAVAWAGRRFGLIPRATGATQGRRLRVLEVAQIDARRRLVLVQRDEVEHLILLGQSADLLVESHIGPRAGTEVKA
jgi:flagellar protein FliO/FliZ